MFSLCNYANGVILVFLLLTVNIFYTISSSNKVILEHTLYTFCIHTIAALDLWKEHLLCFGYYYWYCNIVLYHIISYLYLYGLCSSMSFFSQLYLTVSWRRSLSHRNFLYDREVRHERVNLFFFWSKLLKCLLFLLFGLSLQNLTNILSRVYTNMSKQTGFKIPSSFLIRMSRPPRCHLHYKSQSLTCFNNSFPRTWWGCLSIS